MSVPKPHSPSVQFSSDAQSCLTLRPNGLQHARLPCPSSTPRAYSNSCPLSRSWHPTISSSVVPSPPIFNLSQQRVFSNESVLHIRWPKYWSFSFNISPFNEHQDQFPLRLTGWISLSPRDSQESSPTPQFKSINSLVLSLLHSPTLTSIYDHRKNHTLD